MVIRVEVGQIIVCLFGLVGPRVKCRLLGQESQQDNTRFFSMPSSERPNDCVCVCEREREKDG